MLDVPQLTADEILARVLHRDGLMLIIDKPAGLPVHRGPKGGPNLEDSFDALRFGLPRPPVLAHRLDKDTSGCLVLGRHRKATASLGLLFKHGKIGKTYWTVVEGGPTEDEGTIDMGAGDPVRPGLTLPAAAELPAQDLAERSWRRPVGIEEVQAVEMIGDGTVIGFHTGHPNGRNADQRAGPGQHSEQAAAGDAHGRLQR